jgi:hypothetical protein
MAGCATSKKSRNSDIFAEAFIGIFAEIFFLIFFEIIVGIFWEIFNFY